MHRIITREGVLRAIEASCAREGACEGGRQA